MQVILNLNKDDMFLVMRAHTCVIRVFAVITRFTCMPPLQKYAVLKTFSTHWECVFRHCNIANHNTMHTFFIANVVQLTIPSMTLQFIFTFDVSDACLYS